MEFQSPLNPERSLPILGRNEASLRQKFDEVSTLLDTSHSDSIIFSAHP